MHAESESEETASIPPAFRLRELNPEPSGSPHDRSGTQIVRRSKRVLLGTARKAFTSSNRTNAKPSRSPGFEGRVQQ